MCFTTGEFQEKPEVVIDWLARTVRGNQKIANQIFSTKRNVYAYRRGSILEPAVSVTFDGEKCAKVISRIIRGLYWMQKGEALGYESEINVFMPQNMKPDFIKSMMELMDRLTPYYLNKDTFTYKVHFDEDGSSFWGMQFFKRFTVFGYAEKPEI